MNIIIDPDEFNVQNVFFLDKKKNNIIDGCFSKIIYSSEYFTMNGIFFVIPFINKSIHHTISICNTAPFTSEKLYSQGEPLKTEFLEKKYTVCFYTHNVNNLQYISLLSKIENVIINTYKEMNGLKKYNNLVLTNQLYKGYFKIYKEKQSCKSPNEKKYMLKISGVWENANEVGITYKFIEICDNAL